MIVVGVDCHKKTHTAVGLDRATGECKGELTVKARDGGHQRLLEWARSIDPEITFALEDCRHVSGRLERHLLVSGETVLRVPPKLMAGARRSSRTRGKSDPIDAEAVARAAIRAAAASRPDAPSTTPSRSSAVSPRTSSSSTGRTRSGISEPVSAARSRSRTSART